MLAFVPPPGWSTANGVRLGVWPCKGGANQNRTAPPEGTIRLAGKCLDVAGSGTANGTKLTIQACQAEDPGTVWHVL